jgi:hypothetical protein
VSRAQIGQYHNQTRARLAVQLVVKCFIKPIEPEVPLHLFTIDDWGLWSCGITPKTENSFRVKPTIDPATSPYRCR